MVNQFKGGNPTIKSIATSSHCPKLYEELVMVVTAHMDGDANVWPIGI